MEGSTSKPITGINLEIMKGVPSQCLLQAWRWQWCLRHIEESTYMLCGGMDAVLRHIDGSSSKPCSGMGLVFRQIKGCTSKPCTAMEVVMGHMEGSTSMPCRRMNVVIMHIEGSTFKPWTGMEVVLRLVTSLGTWCNEKFALTSWHLCQAMIKWTIMSVLVPVLLLFCNFRVSVTSNQN